MNVIVILCDSLRWDCLGHNGNSWIKTPRLDQFSKECGIFDNMYTEGLPTLPQRTAAFTGRYTFPWRGWENMKPTDERLSEILFQHGIYPALITDSFPMFEMGYGYVERFREVKAIPCFPAKAPPDAEARVDWKRYLPEGRRVNMDCTRDQAMRRALWKSDEESQVALVMKDALKWIDNYEGSDPYMLWVDSFDPHEPWYPPEEFWRQYDPKYAGELLAAQPYQRMEGFDLTPREEEVMHALYAGMVSVVDKWVGFFFDQLRAKGVLDDTMIVFTSDHGLPLGEGIWGHGAIRKFTAWPYEELAHTPLLIRHPQGHGAGKRFATHCQSCDLTATVLGGFGIPPTPRMHSRSLLPVLQGEVDRIRDFSVACHSAKLEQGASRSIRTADWTYFTWPQGKLTLPPESKRTPGVEELYRRPGDLTEQNNVIAQYPEVAKELAQTLRRFEDELTAGGE